MMKRKLLVSAVLSTLYAPFGMADMPVVSVEFTETKAPITTEQLQKAYTESSAIVTYANGKKSIFPLSYNALYSSGEQIGNWKAGTIVDKNGNILQTAQIDEAGTTAQGPFYAHSPDANSLMKQGDNIFLVTHLEYDTEAPNVNPSKPMVSMYGALPMVMNLASIKQNHRNGMLNAFDLKNVDMSGVDGLWIPCAGELTPWNTHIGGEEYEPDARAFQSKPLTAMNLFLDASAQLPPNGANPYKYGMITEVTVSKKGNSEVVKHYAMGRLANELAHVMPDGRTAYKGDDGRDVVLTMFVADKAKDLSKGTIYAAKLQQNDGSNGGQFGIQWIKLGHASDSEINAIVASGIQFSDIFDIASKTEYQANPAAYADYKAVYAYTGTGGKTALEYLKVKAGMDKAAAFLETRRYAAYMGATTEFTKMEGETSNNADKKLYVAMSYVQNSMLAGQNADHPADDIHLDSDPKDLACGIVYESNLKGGQQDTSGNPINSQWVATDMNALLMGAQKPATQTAYGTYDKCDTDKMANPDNLKYSEAMRTLFIGEDSGNHLNNFLWAYNVDTKKSTRIATNRAGAEWTGLQAVDDMNGFAYIMSNIQHPGAADDLSGYKSKIPEFDAFRAGIDQRGVVGYIGGLPAIKVKKTEEHHEHEIDGNDDD
ncbi:PhoX family protein [Sulfurirhabdus autotrophica]|uniref:DUF839 domain-containing protein n=1 Tax=Sulfurirhabdus autotrophica TaxID=1706046 RepID=A0A4V2W0Y3_9PROT|nr:alkaline phosphatase PhoX [Sulfurirhabdus autotrophica]TCV81255.1 hypothetical protein EDC63_1242 [Sulfurirhabdus autotrophica]